MASLDSDPLLPTSVTVAYTDPVIAIITTTGADAAAGYTVGGPSGAIIGGVAGLVEASIGVSNWTKPMDYKKDSDPAGNLRAHLCEKSAAFAQIPSATDIAPSLTLPLIVSYPLDTQGDDETARCWNPLPIRNSDAPMGIPPAPLWYYRILPDNDAEINSISPLVNNMASDSSKGKQTIVTSESFFGLTPPTGRNAETNSTPVEQEHYFPVSACRAVTLEIAWWNVLNQRTDAAAAALGENGVRTFKLVVSDPRWVQRVLLPQKGGAITLLPTCGAFAANAGAATAQTTAIGTLMQQSATVKTAEENYRKAHLPQTTTPKNGGSGL